MVTVEQLRQLEQAATPGEWTTHHRADTDWLTQSMPQRDKDTSDHEPGSLAGPVWPRQQRPAFCSGWPHRNARADAELIAAARNALPALLDIAEAAELVTVDASDDGSGHPAAIEDPNIAELATLLDRLDTEGGT